MLYSGLGSIINMAYSSSFQPLASTNPQEFTTTETSVTSLISGLQSQYDTSSSTLSTSSTHAVTSGSRAVLSSVGELPKSCGFLTLAGELRNIIYGYLITSGQIEILRVSRQLHDEANGLLYKQGICRLCFELDSPKHQPKSLRQIRIPSNNKVQNFNLLIFPSPTSAPLVSRGFVHSVHASGDCHIILVCRKPCLYAPDTSIAPLFIIEFLSTFKLLTLRIHFSHTLHPMDRRNRTVMEPRHTQKLKAVAASLSSALGSPEWKPDTCPSACYQTFPRHSAQPSINPFPNAQYLEFHPRKGREIAGGVHH